MDDQSFVARRPRYEVEPNARCPVTITVSDSGQIMQGYLSDLSRHGMKLVTSEELPCEIAVAVQAELPTGRMEIDSAAMIRWSRIQDDGQWSAGLVFQRELSWELMGEMFLSGVLSVQANSGTQRPTSV